MQEFQISIMFFFSALKKLTGEFIGPVFFGFSSPQLWNEYKPLVQGRLQVSLK